MTRKSTPITIRGMCQSNRRGQTGREKRELLDLAQANMLATVLYLLHVHNYVNNYCDFMTLKQLLHTMTLKLHTCKIQLNSIPCLMYTSVL